MDHINGLTFFDGISKLKKDIALRKAKKLGFKYNMETINGKYQ
jgi:peptide deformylase